MDRFYDCFGDLPDPRAKNASHDLCEMLFIALLASLCGARSCADMAEFGRSKEPLLRQILTLKHGIASHDTFSRLFRLLDPEAFEAAFRRFMAAFAHGARLKKTKGVVALDGKALRRAYARGEAHMPKLMVTAWAAETRMTLASRLAPEGNETRGALDLVGLLQLKGCVVTGDALHGHSAMAAAVTQRGGDYVLAIKDNRPGLLQAAIAVLETSGPLRSAQTNETAHGRREQRTAVVAKAPGMAFAHDFPGLKAVARLTSQREGAAPSVRHFLLSKPYTPQRLLSIVRAHWGIENTLNWTLDVVQGEDLARSRKDNAPANLAVLRRLANNIARAHPDTKTSLRRKLLRAAWDEAFLFELIRHMR